MLWSERRADLLRRVAAGERINDQVDWDNVIEEVKRGPQRDRYRPVAAQQRRWTRKLRLLGWPDHPAARSTGSTRPARGLPASLGGIGPPCTSRRRWQPLFRIAQLDP